MSLSEERLYKIRGRANLQCGLDGDDADDLLIHVDHLTAELATARTAWDEWKTSSRAGHAHASAMADEVARLREGIADAGYNAEVNPSDDTRALNTLLGDLRALLNPPTEGETDD